MKRKNKISNVTALIVSFFRYEYLEKCISSLREHYPHIKIIIGNNGTEDIRKEKLAKKYGAEYYQLPFDCGICVARNFLVNKIKTKYTMVGDDDFFYTEETGLENIYKAITRNKNFDLVGGRILENGTVRDYQGFIEEYPTHFIYKKLEIDFDEEVQSCDITFNYFIAKTKSLKAVKWDEKIKVAYEHSTYFIDFKRAGYKVAFCPHSIVVHKPKIDVEDKAEYEEYKYYRMRKSDKERFFERFGIDYVIGMNGKKDIKDNSSDIKKVEIKEDVYLGDIDFCITTFLRKDALLRLLLSIQKHYPQAHILIADQSFDAEWYKKIWNLLKFKNKPIAYKMSYDCGLSKARNYLVGISKRKYKLILEDDFVFTDKTSIINLLKIAELTKLPTGGAMWQAGKIRHFEHRFKKDGTTLYHIKDGDNWKEFEGIKYKETGCLLNFMLVTSQRWDENIKISGEHTDFFLRYPNAVYVPEVIIEHIPETNDEYAEKRKREEFLVEMMKKHNIEKIVYLNGAFIKKKFGKIIKGRNKDLIH